MNRFNIQYIKEFLFLLGLSSAVKKQVNINKIISALLGIGSFAGRILEIIKVLSSNIGIISSSIKKSKNIFRVIVSFLNLTISSIYKSNAYCRIAESKLNLSLIVRRTGYHTTKLSSIINIIAERYSNTGFISTIIAMIGFLVTKVAYRNEKTRKIRKIKFVNR